MNRRSECDIAFISGSACFGTSENEVFAERLIEIRKAFGRTILEYISYKDGGET